MNQSLLLSPFRLGPYELSNRLVMAPLTRTRTGPQGVPGPLNAEYYRQRAGVDGAGLIISEGTWPHPDGRGYWGQPGLWNAAQVAGWRLVTNAVHARGALIFAQIHHAGRISHPHLLPEGKVPIAPSALAARGEVHTQHGKFPYPVPHVLERGEISVIVEQFAHATENAWRAGFDGVELHGANGYLPHEFLSASTNHRTDDYGGSIPNRTRFFLEVVRAMASVRGPQYVGVKVSTWKFAHHDIEDLDTEVLYPYLARELSRTGILYLHVQRPLTDWGMEDAPFDVVKLLRPHFSGALFAGGMFGRANGERVLENNDADLVVSGRQFISNPDLVRRFALNSPLQPDEMATWYGQASDQQQGYIDYPVWEPIAAE